MTVATGGGGTKLRDFGHRARWVAVWVLVALWFVAQAANVGGNAVHLILLVAIALLVYELLAEEPPAKAD